MKEKRFRNKKARSRRYLAENIMKTDDVSNLTFLVDIPDQVE